MFISSTVKPQRTKTENGLETWKRRLKPERQAESLVRVAQEGFNLRDQLPAHFLLCYRWQGPCLLLPNGQAVLFTSEPGREEGRRLFFTSATLRKKETVLVAESKEETSG